jgi:NAD+ synthase (glutamine-hydrolysing)
MKVAFAQTNTTVGDIQGNLRRAQHAIREAVEREADLVLLPELALSGYPPQDLAERPAFLRANEAAVEELASFATRTAVVVGHLARASSATGRRATNSASVLKDGRVLQRRDKMLLPNYDVFDEMRHFQPAQSNEPFDLDGCPIGVTICEDAWNDERFWPQRLYERDPVAELVRAGARLIVNIAASPYAAGRQALRRRMLSATASGHGVPVAYLNLVGGNDQLIFEGRSLFVDAGGHVAAEAAAFREDMMVVDIEQAGSPVPPAEPKMVEDVWRALILGLHDYCRKCGFRQVVFGMSGGVDSALTAAIAAEALGPRNVITLFMPSRVSSELSRTDAEAVARNLGVDFRVIPINEIHRSFEGALAPAFEGTQPGTAEENVQARIRGDLVMALANKFNMLPLATGNKSELAVGYCTLYGDMVGGLAVIGDVPKTLVYELARYANRNGEVITRSVLEKAPTAELKPNQTDQDVLPPYEVLDAILNLYIEEVMEFGEIVQEGYDPQLVRRVLTMVDRAEYKRRQAPITLRVTHKAFGPGRRLPVAQNWTR